MLCCGGVNATATILAAAHRAVAADPAPVVALADHVVVGAVAHRECLVARPARRARPVPPPFLDWIERSADVVREIDLLDVARGTTHWLDFVVTSGGEWWPAG